MPINVLITGAHGLIGNLLYAQLATQPGRYTPYGSARRIDASLRAIKQHAPIPDERLRIADVHSWEETIAALAGMHTVVHLAGNANSVGPWEDMLRDNIIGAHNVCEAARLARLLGEAVPRLAAGTPPVPEPAAAVK